MGFLNIISEGDWYLHSDSDSRWNISGTGMVGGGVMPQDCERALEKLKEEYGEPPEDLRFGYMKF